ncbi:hypothetical protein DV738_g169, partial [Chaetothyriales sp. CBS 135597]
MSLALKFSSLAIRTLSKPIANFIKRQAREHEGFRRTCINFAQKLHRIDMRWRIGLLQDAAAVEKQAAREAAQDAAKRHKHTNIPTVKTEAQTKAEEEAAAKAAKEGTSEASKHKPQPRIRPLSEAKAIESGANFISETFLFGVAASLILLESWRSRKKESTRRDDVAERLADLEFSEKAARQALVELEREVLRLKAKESGGSVAVTKRILPKEVYEAESDNEEPAKGSSQGWLSRIITYISSKPGAVNEAKTALETNSPGPAEKILVAADEEIAEKHKKRELETKREPESHPERSQRLTGLMATESTAVATDMTALVTNAHNTPQTRSLQILLLTIADAQAQDCVNRLQAFVSAIKPANAVDLVLLVKDTSESDQDILPALCRLQIELLDLGHVPVVAAYSPDEVVPQQRCRVLTGLFPTIEQLAQATRTAHGQAAIRSSLPSHTADQVIEFWEDEWLV